MATSLLELLKVEMNNRKKINPRFSIRAFAEELGMEHSFLSKILTGERSVTALTIARIGSRLNLSELKKNILIKETLRKKAKKLKL